MEILKSEFIRLRAEQFPLGSNADPLPLEPSWFSEYEQTSSQHHNSNKDSSDVNRGLINLRKDFTRQLQNELASAEQRFHSLEEKLRFERFTIDYLRSTLDKLGATSDIEDVNSSTRSSSEIGAVTSSSPRNSFTSLGPDNARSGASSPNSEFDMSCSSIGVVFERKRNTPASPLTSPLITSLALHPVPSNGENPTQYANIEALPKASRPVSVSKPSPPERTSSSIHRQVPLTHTPRTIYGGTLRGDRSSGGSANLPPPVPEHRKSKSVERLQLVGTSQPSMPTPEESQSASNFRRSAKEPVYEQIWEQPQAASVSPASSNAPPKPSPEAFSAVSNVEKSGKATPTPPQLTLREIVSSEDTYSSVAAAETLIGNMSKSSAAGGSGAARTPVPPPHPPPAPPLPPHTRTRTPPPLEHLSSFVGKGDAPAAVAPVVLRHAEATASLTTSSSSPVLPSRTSNSASTSATARLSTLELDAVSSVSNPLSDDDEDDDLDRFLLDAERPVVYENSRAGGSTAISTARPPSRASKTSSGGEPSPALSAREARDQPADGPATAPKPGATARRRSGSPSALSTSSTDSKTTASTTAAARETSVVLPEKPAAAPPSSSAIVSAGPSAGSPLSSSQPQASNSAKLATIRPMTLGERLSSDYVTTIGVLFLLVVCHLLLYVTDPCHRITH